jgi:AcrR family transcriptional regulator
MPRSAAANRQLQQAQRANLLAAARRVFFRGGASATMADLAAEAGVSQGLAYRYFRSKEAIFRAMIEESLDPKESLAHRLGKIPGGPRAQLTAIVTGVLERRRQAPEFYRYFYRALADGDLSPSLRRRLQARFEELHRALRHLVVEAQAAGEIGSDDPEELVTVLLAALEGLWRRTSRTPEGGANDNIPHAEVLLRMLGSPSTPPARRSVSGRGA